MEIEKNVRFIMGLKCVRLRFPCPGNICPKDEIKKWFHTCGSKMYMTEEVDLLCEDHKGDRDFIQNWGFKCNGNNHEGGHVGFTLSSVGMAFGYAIAAMEKYQAYDAENATQMLQKMQMHVFKQWKK